MTATGYRPNRTLPLRVELVRQLKRRRTQVTFALVALLPVILLAAFELADDGPPTGSLNFVDLAKGSAVNFTVFALFASAGFLLVVVVTLFFGDTVASEASWSSLRYLLAAPIPRARLLRQKAIVAGFLSVAAILLLPVVSLLVGGLAYGTGDLVSPRGESLTFGDAAARVLLGALYIAVHLSWVAGLALLLSVSTDAPLGAVGGAVMASIVSQILDQITALEDLRNYLPTHYGNDWANLLAQDIDWGDMTRGVFSAVTYATVSARSRSGGSAARTSQADDPAAAHVFYAALLQHIGCTAYSHEVSLLFADETSIKRAGLATDRETAALILDNGSSHTSKKTRKWLSEHPRFTVTYHPLPREPAEHDRDLRSRIPTRRMLRRGDFASRNDLIEKITTFIETCNGTAEPFRWTYAAKPLRAAPERGQPGRRRDREHGPRPDVRCGAWANGPFTPALHPRRGDQS